MRPDFRDRLHGTENVARVRHRDESRLRADRGANRFGIDGAAGVGGNARERDALCFGERDERPRNAVVFEVGGDDVIAVVEHPFERHVEGVGAVERERPAVGVAAVEEPVEPVPGVGERVFGRERHLVPGASGVGECMPREVVESGVDALRLGETRRRVVEVGHRGAFVTGEFR